jgi:DNA polymerase-1
LNYPQSIFYFKAVWSIDFEFKTVNEFIVEVHCCVLKDFLTGRVVRLFAEELKTPPSFLQDEDIVFITFYGIAEFRCFLKLGWCFPKYHIDLYVEFSNLVNNTSYGKKKSLLSVLNYYGFDCLESQEKDEMRELAMRGSPYSNSERLSLLDYCQSDVEALEKILPKIISDALIPYSLLRGDYIKSLAVVEENGIAVDHKRIRDFEEHFPALRLKLVKEFDPDNLFYDGLVFKYQKLLSYVKKNNIDWPLLDSGLLDMKEATFKAQAQKDGVIQSIYQLRQVLSKTTRLKPQVGPDGRCRCMLSPFASKTSRNQPSTNEFPFGWPAMMRSLMRASQ